eukprot:COSAG02_NODE_18749_length_921_cov_1.177616_1_plen_284_part_10
MTPCGHGADCGWLSPTFTNGVDSKAYDRNNHLREFWHPLPEGCPEGVLACGHGARCPCLMTRYDQLSHREREHIQTFWHPLDPELVAQLVSMGFSEADSVAALKEKSGDVIGAADWLLARPAEHPPDLRRSVAHMWEPVGQEPEPEWEPGPERQDVPESPEVLEADPGPSRRDEAAVLRQRLHEMQAQHQREREQLQLQRDAALAQLAETRRQLQEHQQARLRVEQQRDSAVAAVAGMRRERDQLQRERDAAVRQVAARQMRADRPLSDCTFGRSNFKREYDKA